MINGKRLEYDLNGNRQKMTECGLSTSYKYDSLDRLVEVKTADGDIFYEYDSDGRCILRREGEEQELYLYDERNEIGMVRNGEIEELRILGDTTYGEIGSAILLELKGKKYIPIHDLSGDVVLLMTSEGEEVQKYLISSFGEVSILDIRGQEMEERVENPWVVQSKRKDKRTGLVNFGLRFYDTQVGMFINPDPQGLAEIPNPYAYMYNNPRSGCDVYGLEPEQYEYNGVILDEKHGLIARNPRSSVSYEAHDLAMGFTRETNSKVPSWTYRAEEDGTRHFDLGRNGYVYFGKEEGQQSFSFDLGRKVLKDGGVGFINGICNSLGDCIDSAKMISDYGGGINVCGVYNATHGRKEDGLEAVVNIHFQTITNPSMRLASMWITQIKKLPDWACFLQLCHSQGAVMVRTL